MFAQIKTYFSYFFDIKMYIQIILYIIGLYVTKWWSKGYTVKIHNSGNTNIVFLIVVNTRNSDLITI